MSYLEPTALERIRANAHVVKTGVRCGFVDQLLREDAYTTLVREFPDVSRFALVDKQSGGGRKRFYVGPEYVVQRNWGSLHHLRSLSDIWRAFIDECASPSFIAALSAATGVQFNSLTNFGFTYGNEGCVQEPHLDGAIRPGDTGPIKGTIALLLYFNEDSDPVSATELYDLDKKTILAKSPTMHNALFWFGQHPKSWHGFPPVSASHERRLVSLAYSQQVRPVGLHWDLFHQLVPLEKWRWERERRSVS